MAKRLFVGKPCEVTISGLKCDSCSYCDEDVSVFEFESYIDKPCPGCGESLLTPEDYRNTLALIGIAALSNEESPPVDTNLSVERATIRFGMDGSGAITILDDGARSGIGPESVRNRSGIGPDTLPETKDSGSSASKGGAASEDRSE